MRDPFDVDPFDPAALDDGDTAVVSARGSGADRQAVLVPRSVSRATDEQHDALHDLQAAAVAVREAQERLRATVVQARELSISWSLVGWCVGTTPQAAQERYDPGFQRRPRSSKPARRRSR